MLGCRLHQWLGQTQAYVAANAPLWGCMGTANASTDDLATAATGYTPFSGGPNITAAWVNTAHDPATWLIGAADGRVAVTPDGGAHFTIVNGPDGHAVIRAHIDSFNQAHWFALTQHSARARTAAATGRASRGR